MDELLSQIFLLVFFSMISAFLVISIFKKELPVLTRYSQYNYKGKRAIFLSTFFLIIFAFPLLWREINKSDLILVTPSLIIGVCIAFVLHGNYSKNPGIIVPEKIKPRKIIASNFVLWGIVGIFAGFISAGLLSQLALIAFRSDSLAIAVGISVFSFTVVLIAWLGARTTWL